MTSKEVLATNEQSDDEPQRLPSQLQERLERDGPPKAFVFDMDGLIFNSEDLYDIACDKVLSRRDKHFTRDIKLQIMGKKAPIALKLLCDLAGINEPIQSIREELETDFRTAVEQSLETMPGFDALIHEVESRGIRRAIATSSSRHLAELMLHRFDLVSRFEFVLTGDDVVQGKPNPEIYLRAAERLGMAASSLVVLEDSHTGTQAAKAADAITIAVPNRHTKDCDFSHVDLVANTLEDELIRDLLSLM